MKKVYAILAVALLLSTAVSRADEGPLHWAARHVRNAVVGTGETASNIARTAGRTIYHRTGPIREVFR
jgi:hypothetical protein